MANPRAKSTPFSALRLNRKRDAAHFIKECRERLQPAQAERFVKALLESDAQPVAASPNAKWVLFPEGNALVVWNVFADGQQRILSHQSGSIVRGRFSPDSRFLVTVGRDSEVRLWRTDDWSSKVLCPNASRIWGIGFSGDSRIVAISQNNTFIRVFDLTEEPRPVLVNNEGSKAFSVAISMSGRYLATGHSEGEIRIWDVESGETIATLEGHTSGVFSLSFSPDDLTLASACSSASVKLWHVATWHELMSVQADANNVQFSHDGRYLAAIVLRSVSDAFQNEGLGILKTPTLQEIDAIPVSE